MRINTACISTQTVELPPFSDHHICPSVFHNPELRMSSDDRAIRYCRMSAGIQTATNMYVLYTCLHGVLLNHVSRTSFSSAPPFQNVRSFAATRLVFACSFCNWLRFFIQSDCCGLISYGSEPFFITSD